MGLIPHRLYRQGSGAEPGDQVGRPAARCLAPPRARCSGVGGVRVLWGQVTHACYTPQGAHMGGCCLEAVRYLGMGWWVQAAAGTYFYPLATGAWGAIRAPAPLVTAWVTFLHLGTYLVTSHAVQALQGLWGEGLRCLFCASPFSRHPACTSARGVGV